MIDLEYWVLRIADSNLTWFGFNWLRPAKERHVGWTYILLSSLLLGLPGIGVGAGVVYCLCGSIESWVWPVLFAAVLAFEVLMHMLFAHFWNRRASALAE